MLTDDTTLISVDDYVVEPPHVFLDHIESRYRARRPGSSSRDRACRAGWECDFPHNDSNWPNSRKVLAEALDDVPDDEARRIAETNARSLCNFY